MEICSLANTGCYNKPMDITKNFGCISCGEPCGGGCGPCAPASYKCDFSISAVPFDPTSWNVNLCGTMHKIKLPPLAETDTTLSTNYSNSVLNYKAEKHVDTLTGQQLGSLINLGDLRDTKTDYTTSSMCYELIYKKYGDCGEGCMSIEDTWATFSIDNENALGPQIRYVRGANRYGCPYFLDVPQDTSQYWFQGWRGDTNENGYYQPAPVSTLPTDPNGNYYVLSQYPSNKQPVVGVLPWQCMLENIFGNLGMSVQGQWTEVQGTPGFTSWFDPIQGYFTINWTDWNDLAATQRAGYGQISGKVNWEIHFDTQTGSMIYTVKNVFYERMTWTVDQGVTQPTAPRMMLTGLAIPSGTETPLLDNWITFGRANVNQPINKTIPSNLTVTVGPGQTFGPYNFVKIYVDWVGDDEGYMGITFKSNLNGWQSCM